MEEINNAIRDFIKDKDKNDYKYYVDSEREYYIQEDLVKIIRDNLEEYFRGRLYND